MCHVIRAHQDYSFIRDSNSMNLIGSRCFSKAKNINKKEVLTPYYKPYDNFEITRLLNDSLEVTTSMPRRTQDVEFQFNERDTNINYLAGDISFRQRSRTIEKDAGIHINGFFNQNGDGGDTIDFSIHDSNTRLPVRFYLSDLVFFDGIAISVDKFYLLTEVEMKKVLDYIIKDWNVPNYWLIRADEEIDSVPKSMKYRIERFVEEYSKLLSNLYLTGTTTEISL